MIITREIDYAIRILRRLQGGELMPTPEICRLENLPINFAYRILKKLDKAGVVDIARGKDGGVRLAGDLGKLTMFDLMNALDARRYVSSCMKPEFDCEYRRAHGGRCGVHDNLSAMQDDFDNMLRNKTLIQIVRDA